MGVHAFCMYLGKFLRISVHSLKVGTVGTGALLCKVIIVPMNANTQ